MKQILGQLWKQTNEQGNVHKTPKGTFKYLNAVTLVLEETEENQDRYPYWDKQSEQWYLSTFVNKENGPPEDWKYHIVFPYTYSWRAHYNDSGWSHVRHIIEVLQDMNYSDIPFRRQEDLDAFIKETYTKIHPDIFMAVLAWQGQRNMQGYLMQPEFLQHVVNMSRLDLINEVKRHLQEVPVSRKAVADSMIYPNLDLEHLLEHMPSYLTFQAAVSYNEKDEPVGLETFHLQSKLDASGPAQLDLAQDIMWGKEIADSLELPLLRVHIHTNQAYLDISNNNEKQQTNITRELLRTTDGYIPEEYDIEERLASPTHKLKATFTLNRLNPSE